LNFSFAIEPSETPVLSGWFSVKPFAVRHMRRRRPFFNWQQAAVARPQAAAVAPAGCEIAPVAMGAIGAPLLSRGKHVPPRLSATDAPLAVFRAILFPDLQSVLGQFDAWTMKGSPSERPPREPRYGGVKSIDFVCRLLDAMSRRDTSALKELAQDTSTQSAKLHRYLSSLVRGGLVTQDPITRRYSLGPLAFQVGLRSIRSQDPLKTAMRMQVLLRDRLDETAVLCVWSPQGPTVIRVEESSKPILMTIRVGALLPVLATATGLVFAAYLPPQLTRELIDAELPRTTDQTGSPLHTRKDVETELEIVRRQGFAVNNEYLMRGVSAVAIPVFSFQEQLTGVISVISREPITDRCKVVVEAMKCARKHMRA
jgi:DNA-binding IclR family transcriptional regulator